MKYRMMVECRESGAIGVFHWREYVVETTTTVNTDTFEGKLWLANRAGDMARNDGWETCGVYLKGAP